MNVFLRPNLARCLWVTPLTSLIFMSLTLAIRHWVGMTPIFDSQQMLTIGYIAAVFGFLIGIGAFDTWFPWMIGSPTRPEDHSAARRVLVARLLPLQHRPQGDRRCSTSPRRSSPSSSAACSPRSSGPSWRTRVRTSSSTQQYNGFMSQHGTLMIFTFLVPVFAGLGNFVIPLMLGAPDMAFPRLNALSFWLLPLALADLPVVVPGRLVRGRLDGLPAVLDRRARWARRCSSWASR